MFPTSYFPANYFPETYFPRGADAATATTWISAAQLLAMRTTMAASFPDVCTLTRYTVAADGQGGDTRTWATVGGYRCRLRQTGQTETDAEGRLVAVTQWTLLLPWLTPIQPADRVTISGVVYEVTETDLPRTESLCREVQIVRVD